MIITPERLAAVHSVCQPPGTAAAVLLAMLVMGGRSVGTRQLRTITGHSEDKITQALQLLEMLGLAENRARYNGWCLASSSVQAWLPGMAPELSTSYPQKSGSPLLADSALNDDTVVNLTVKVDQEQKQISSPPVADSIDDDVLRAYAEVGLQLNQRTRRLAARVSGEDVRLAWRTMTGKRSQGRLVVALESMADNPYEHRVRNGETASESEHSRYADWEA